MEVFWDTFLNPILNLSNTKHVVERVVLPEKNANRTTARKLVVGNIEHACNVQAAEV